MSEEKPYTMKGEIVRLISEAVPGQKIKRITFNSLGGVAEVVWYESDNEGEPSVAPPSPAVLP